MLSTTFFTASTLGQEGNFADFFCAPKNYAKQWERTRAVVFFVGCTWSILVGFILNQRSSGVKTETSEQWAAVTVDTHFCIGFLPFTGFYLNSFHAPAKSGQLNKEIQLFLKIFVFRFELVILLLSKAKYFILKTSCSSHSNLQTFQKRISARRPLCWRLELGSVESQDVEMGWISWMIRDR